MNDPRTDDVGRALTGLVDTDSLIHLGLAILALVTCIRLFGEPPPRVVPADDVVLEVDEPGIEE